MTVPLSISVYIANLSLSLSLSPSLPMYQAERSGKSWNGFGQLRYQNGLAARRRLSYFNPKASLMYNRLQRLLLLAGEQCQEKKKGGGGMEVPVLRRGNSHGSCEII